MRASVHRRLASISTGGVMSVVGAGTLGVGTELSLGVICLAGCQDPCDEFLSHKFTDTEVVGTLGLFEAAS